MGLTSVDSQICGFRSHGGEPTSKGNHSSAPVVSWRFSKGLESNMLPCIVSLLSKGWKCHFGSDGFPSPEAILSARQATHSSPKFYWTQLAYFWVRWITTFSNASNFESYNIFLRLPMLEESNHHCPEFAAANYCPEVNCLRIYPFYFYHYLVHFLVLQKYIFLTVSVVFLGVYKLSTLIHEIRDFPYKEMFRVILS